MTDHAEQGMWLLRIVDFPAGVEDFVPTVLGISLRKHHQLDVAWITTQLYKGFDQIGDLVISQRQTQFCIGCDQCCGTLFENVDLAITLRSRSLKQRGERVERVHDGFDHTIV